VISGGALPGPSRLWRSADLIEWQEVSLPGAQGTLATVVDGPSGMVAFGSELSSSAALLWRPGDGQTWAQPVRTKKAAFSTLEPTPDGLLIAGHRGTSAKPVPALWAATSGGDLDDTSLASLRKGGRAADIAVTPSGEVAVQTTTYEGGKPRLHQRNVEGDWSAVRPPALRDGQPELVVGGLSGTSSGAVMATNEDGRGIIWYAPDALAWTPVATGSTISSLLRASDSVVAMPEGLISEDGIRWCRAGLAVPDDALATGAASLPDGRLVIVGTRLTTDEDGESQNVPVAWVATRPLEECEVIEAPATV
jgi:hypothetical protein